MNGELDELSEKEREKRKEDQIAFRNKQKTSRIFLLIGTICEIIISLAVIIFLFVISVILLARVFHFPDNVSSVLFNIFLVIDFVGGLAGGFFIYKVIGRWVINKWNLKDKLRDDVLNQFKTTKEFKEDYEKKNQR